MPSLLNIGLSYDFLFSGTHRLTALGNFTANSFSQDQVGAGLEYSLNNMFMIRGGYRYEFGSDVEIEAPIYTGLSAGASVSLPLSKENKKRAVSPSIMLTAIPKFGTAHIISAFASVSDNL